jgi:predicted GIY-YIG superfamily endonuclease
MNYACYCLVSGSKTYIGCTNNLDRRLNQHNGKQHGGAKATRGRTWTRVISVLGFPHQQAALQFEWMWKYLSRKKSGSPIQKRCLALVDLCNQEKATSHAVDFSTFEGPLNICIEDLSCSVYFQDKEMKYGIVVE